MKYEDITFVVQGPIRQETKKTLDSIRKNFKDSKIILSTWEESNVTGLSYDKVLYNKDPGVMDIKKQGVVVGKENTNRQIISTHKGLSHVKTLYTVKLRTDTPLLNCNIVKLQQKGQAYMKDLNFMCVEERILVSSINTVDPNSHIKFPYHISDWIYFGKTKDLLKIWDGALIPDEEHFSEQNIQEEVVCPRGFDFGRFTAEQLVIYHFLKKNNIVDFNYYCDINDDKIDNALKFILANFYCVHPQKMGLCFEKYNDLINIKFNYKSLRKYFGFYMVTINEVVWRHYYKKYYGLNTTLLEKVEMKLRDAISFIIQHIKKKSQ